MITARHPNRYSEISTFNLSDLESFYLKFLQKFLSPEDFNRIKVTFDSGLNSLQNSRILNVQMKDNGQSFFSCILATMPGCCGYLVMSSIHGPVQSNLEAVISGVLDLAWFLNYQEVFASHICPSNWYTALSKTFDVTRETGINPRTSNQLVIFSKDMSTQLPAHIYDMPQLVDTFEYE